MCRADVTPAAREPLGALLTAMRDALAAQWSVHPGAIRVGPVDLGNDGNGEATP